MADDLDALLRRTMAVLLRAKNAVEQAHRAAEDGAVFSAAAIQRIEALRQVNQRLLLNVRRLRGEVERCVGRSEQCLRDSDSPATQVARILLSDSFR